MGEAASLIFYIASFLLSVLFVYWGNKDHARRINILLGKRSLVINPLLILAVAIPVLIAGFRQGVGTDFNNYIVEYNAATQSGSYLEISFNIIASISSTLFGSPVFMFTVFSLMTVVPVMLAVNKLSEIHKDYIWLYWMLFLFIVFPQTFNLLRQGVAVGIGFYLVISIIESRRLFKLSHLVALLLAVSFHSSAWILALVGFIAHAFNNKNKNSLILFVCLSTVVAIIGISVLPDLLQLVGSAWTSYLGSSLVSRSVVPRSLLILFILIIAWKFYTTLKIVNSYSALLWVGLLFSLGGLFVTYFERAGYYTSLLVPLLLIVVIAQLVPKSQLRLINSIIFIFSLAYFVGVYYLMGSSDIFPYNWSV